MQIETHVSTYNRVISMLNDYGIQYRVIDHPPEGRTHAASVVRGHPSSQAAKCMVIEVRIERYALCVVPGDTQVDLDAVRELYGGTRARLAPSQTAELLTECERGTIVPFSFRPGQLELITDPRLLEQKQMYFNAARLDRSLTISTEDFLHVAKPRLEVIAERSHSSRPAASTG